MPINLLAVDTSRSSLALEAVEQHEPVETAYSKTTSLFPHPPRYAMSIDSVFSLETLEVGIVGDRPVVQG